MKNLFLFVSALVFVLVTQSAMAQNVPPEQYVPALIRQALLNCQTCPGNQCRGQHPVIRRIPQCQICGQGRECIGHPIAVQPSCACAGQPNRCLGHPIVPAASCACAGASGRCYGHFTEGRIANGLFDQPLEIGPNASNYRYVGNWFENVRQPQQRTVVVQRAAAVPSGPQAMPASVSALPSELFCTSRAEAKTWDLYWDANTGHLLHLSPTGAWTQITEGATAGKAKDGETILLIVFRSGYPGYGWDRKK